MTRMIVKTILLTGDDGYNSIGIRLLSYVLKKKYTLAVAATKTQQSGVGGLMHLRSGGTWGETVIDGIETLWVDGSPIDVIECSLSYYKKPFDLVISGLNLGANIGGSMITSGTVTAAYGSIRWGLAKRAIAISWDMPSRYWFKQHDEEEDIRKYVDYPGKAAADIINISIQKNLWGCEMLNINLPKKKSTTVSFTSSLPKLVTYYTSRITLDRKTNRFIYPTSGKPFGQAFQHQYDIGAVLAGHISITPCNADMVNTDVYRKVKSKKFTI